MAWSSAPISKPHSLSNLAALLSQGLLGSMSRFSHFQIVEWCARFADDFDRLADEHIPASPELALDIADDVVVQWELHLATQYTLEDLNRFAMDDVVLPKPYFESWLNQLLDIPTQH
jgi:hypothetical protein